ncbi:MAG: substrate-binding domain-containing protein [Rubrivivax sp.]|nr:substrate-binding domain-containing protein [Rubrivivax sp.]
MTVAVAVAIVALLGSAAAASEIKVGGTGNALGAMRLLAAAYSRQHPETSVQVLPSLGTSGAIKAVPKGVLDIGLSSRPLTDDEARTGLVATEYARSPLVFAVSVKTKVTGVTLGQLADIYSGQLKNWPDGTQIRPILRQAGDDNTRQVRQISAALDRALTVAEQRPGMPFATNDQETADKIESIPGALGVTTLCLIKSEERSLRALALDGTEATADNAAAGRYPHVKHLYLVTRSEASTDVKRFKAFVNSPAGRDILTRTGHWIP